MRSRAWRGNIAGRSKIGEERQEVILARGFWVAYP